MLRLHVLPRIGEGPVERLTPLALQGLCADLMVARPVGPGLAGGSVLNLHLVLTQALGQAVRWQLSSSNPAAGAQPPRPRRPPRLVVDSELLRRLLEEVSGTWCYLGLTG